MGLMTSALNIRANQERLAAESAEIRARAAAMYGQPGISSGQAVSPSFTSNDLALQAQPAAPMLPPGMSDPHPLANGPMPTRTGDEAAVQRLTRMMTNSPMVEPLPAPPALEGIVPPSGSLVPELPAASLTGAPPAPPAGMPSIGAPATPSQGTLAAVAPSPLEQTRMKIRENFRAMPHQGMEWLQSTFGLQPAEAQEFMRGAGPLSDQTIQKFDQVSQILAQNNQTISLPQMRIGTHTADMQRENQLASNFLQGGAASSPMTAPQDEISQSVQDVGVPITQSLIGAGARGGRAGATEKFQDPLLDSLQKDAATYSGIEGLTSQGKQRFESLAAKIDTRRMVLQMRGSGTPERDIMRMAVQRFKAIPEYQSLSDQDFATVVKSYISGPATPSNVK